MSGREKTAGEVVLVCSSEGCDEPAAESLWLSGNPGHTHDCAEHGHDVREWCDVIDSAPIVDGQCQAKVCTGNEYIWFGQPTPLSEGGVA